MTPAATPLEPESCYQALRARDARFDGLFFVGVTTTGVYCRPICPARTPRPERCQFFARGVEAEQAGFRACLRCRPELAPGRGETEARSRLVREALRLLEGGSLPAGDADAAVGERGALAALAARLGVSARHLRRAMLAELGTSPVALLQSRRLALAKQLLQDTRLSVTEVAFAAGFSSVRRFNALFVARLGRSPSALQREGRGAAGRPGGSAGPRPDRAGGVSSGADPRADGTFTLRLDYRPPLAFDVLLGFLAGRAAPGVELITAEVYERAVVLGEHVGWAQVRADPRRPALRATLSLSLAPVVAEVQARLRALFDLDAQPLAIDERLAADELLAPLVLRRPGLRIPGAFDGFELAVRAILGQQVSVAAASTLFSRLCARFGQELPLPRPERPATASGPDPAAGLVARRLPSAAELAAVPLGEVAALGLPQARARTLLLLAAAVRDGALDLRGGADAQAAITALLALPGIGDWTAQYIALRALRWPDAFPAGDLALRKALGGLSERAALARVDRLRPYRGYAALHLWTALTADTSAGRPTGG